MILDIGGGHYAFYAHLQPGSLRVKLGDSVLARGEDLGLVGNSETQRPCICIFMLHTELRR